MKFIGKLELLFPSTLVALPLKNVYLVEITCYLLVFEHDDDDDDDNLFENFKIHLKQLINLLYCPVSAVSSCTQNGNIYR